MSLTDQEVSAAFLQKVAADTAQEKMQQMQTQMMLQSLHLQTVKDVYVAGIKDSLIHHVGFNKPLAELAPVLDTYAAAAKLAGDRLMVSLGAMKDAAIAPGEGPTGVQSSHEGPVGVRGGVQ